MPAFLLGRFFQGMGLCFIIVVGYATLHELYNEIDAVRVISIMNMITIIAPLSGPLLGALILYFLYSWRMIFVFIAFMAIIALIGLYIYMPETIDKKKHYSREADLLKLSVVKNKYISLLKNNSFMIGSACLAIGGIPIVSWIGISPLILIKASNLSTFHYALWQFPIFILATSGNLLVYRLTHYFTLLQITQIGVLGILFSTMIMLFFASIMDINYIEIITGMSCYAFSWGLSSGSLTRLTLFSTDVSKGTASALMNLICMIMVALGNQISGLLYAGYKNFGFTFFYLFCGILYILFYCIFLKIKNSSKTFPLNN